MKNLKRVTWLDITGQNAINPKKPYRQYLTECETVGEVYKDKDTVIVAYMDNKSDGEKSFDAIPKGCIIKIEDL